VYFLPVDVIDPEDTSGEIVGMEDDGKHDLYIWQLEKVEVTCKYPIKSVTLPNPNKICKL